MGEGISRKAFFKAACITIMTAAGFETAYAQAAETTESTPEQATSESFSSNLATPNTNIYEYVQIGNARIPMPKGFWKQNTDDIADNHVTGTVSENSNDMTVLSDIAIYVYQQDRITGQADSAQSDTWVTWLDDIQQEMDDIICWWHIAESDLGGIKLASASAFFTPATDGSTRIGSIFLAAPGTGQSYVMTIKSPASPHAVCNADRLMWDAWRCTTWSSSLSDTGTDLITQWNQGGKEEFEAQMLKAGIEQNAKSPMYNPYWEVTDFTCILNTSDPNNPYPDHMRYTLTTPEGISSMEDQIFLKDLYITYHDLGSIWCMYRRDSEGTAYERSTVEVEGYGVVDIAYYPEYSSCSYIASTGTPIILELDGVWYPQEDKEPWQPMFYG